MTDEPYKSKEFLALRWKWYAKLKKSGFSDIEYHCRDTGDTLPQMDGMSSMDIQKSVSRWGESKIEYYRLAEQHKRVVAERKRVPVWQVKAWALHADGMGTKAIAAKLRRSTSEVIRFVKQEAAIVMAGGEPDDE